MQVTHCVSPAWKFSVFLFGLIVSVMAIGWWAGGGLVVGWQCAC
jgi:hypothetical protein